MKSDKLPRWEKGRIWLFNHYFLVVYGFSGIGFILPFIFLLFPIYIYFFVITALLIIYIILEKLKVYSLLKIKLLHEGDTILYNYDRVRKKGVFIPLEDFFLQREKQKVIKRDMQLLGKTRVFIKDKKDQNYYFPDINRVIKIYETLSL